MTHRMVPYVISFLNFLHQESSTSKMLPCLALRRKWPALSRECRGIYPPRTFLARAAGSRCRVLWEMLFSALDTALLVSWFLGSVHLSLTVGAMETPLPLWFGELSSTGTEANWMWVFLNYVSYSTSTGLTALPLRPTVTTLTIVRTSTNYPFFNVTVQPNVQPTPPIVLSQSSIPLQQLCKCPTYFVSPTTWRVRTYFWIKRRFVDDHLFYSRKDYEDKCPELLCRR